MAVSRKTPIAAARSYPAAARLLAVSVLSIAASSPARADYACTVLLCLAAPSWRAIAQCVPPVTRLLRELARGHAFPACRMGGPGNQTSHRASFAPGFCPPQYIRERPGPNGPRYFCLYRGAISVTVNGALFTRTWWDSEGDSVTEFLPAAQTQLGTWDSRFDDDYATWLAEQPINPVTAPF